MTGNLGSQNLTLSTKNSRSSGQKQEKSILVMKFVGFYPSRNRNLKCSIGNVIFYFFQVFTFKQTVLTVMYYRLFKVHGEEVQSAK